MKTKERDQQRSALAEWDDEGGAGPSDRGLAADSERERTLDRADKRAALDATYLSSVRGEHRYPGTHQTEAAQKAGRDRDNLKRKLARKAGTSPCG